MKWSLHGNMWAFPSGNSGWNILSNAAEDKDNMPQSHLQHTKQPALNYLNYIRNVFSALAQNTNYTERFLLEFTTDTGVCINFSSCPIPPL